ncbi:MAG: hypothetical protein GY880_24310, partial [Planctomycetaceae bacterium]|nr:hypothetical protein [Planctomycetaceae bacterium]
MSVDYELLKPERLNDTLDRFLNGEVIFVPLDLVERVHTATSGTGRKKRQ